MPLWNVFRDTFIHAALFARFKSATGVGVDWHDMFEQFERLSQTNPDAARSFLRRSLQKHPHALLTSH